MLDLTEFRSELISGDAYDADVSYRSTVFIERVLDILAAGEVLDGVVLCQWQGIGPRQRKVAVSGAAFHPEDDTTSVVLSHFDGTPGETPVLQASEAGKLLRMVSGFLAAALDGALEGRPDPNHAVNELIRSIAERGANLSKVRLFLVTDMKVSARVRELPVEAIGELACELHIWDVARLAELAGRGHEPLEINLIEEFEPVPCLPVHLPTDDYQSYLCVVPGYLLADLYGRYGARLLETNVRGFLSDRGKVNRGLRATIQNRPHMFFAYNNGLTATATDVKTEKAGGEERITAISDLQIVNGGQTTASLFWAKRKHKASLERVFVQMKLSVIPTSMADEFDQVVSDISRFANSQNKVSDADLFANHPFHRAMEKISRRCGVAAADGGQYQTYWFYERARAQYENERTGLSAAQKRAFALKYPKAQLVTKTDLAKFVNAWDQLPHVVSAGAQKSFKRFAEAVTARWEKNHEQFNEVFYKRTMGIAMLYRTLEGLVQKQSWYQGHRAAVVPYTLALLNYLIEREGKKLNLLALWSTQRVPHELEIALVDIAKEVWAGLSAHGDRSLRPQWGNLGEWFKAEQCWDACKGLCIAIPKAIAGILITEAQYNAQDSAGMKAHRVDAGIDAQTEVLKLHDAGYWQRLKDWNQEEPVLSDAEYEGVCRFLAHSPSRVPSEFESRLLMQAKQRAENNGFL